MDQYCKDFVCTYKSLTDDDQDVSDMLYQAQFLQALGLEQYTDEVDTIINLLFDDLRQKHPEFMTELDVALQGCREFTFLVNVFSIACDTPDKLAIMRFRFVLQYAFFDLFHKCMITELADDAAKRALFDALQA